MRTNYTFIIEEIAAEKKTQVRWKVGGVLLAFVDSTFLWSKHGRQGAYQMAKRRVTELNNNEHSRDYARKRAF